MFFLLEVLFHATLSDSLASSTPPYAQRSSCLSGSTDQPRTLLRRLLMWSRDDGVHSVRNLGHGRLSVMNMYPHLVLNTSTSFKRTHSIQLNRVVTGLVRSFVFVRVDTYSLSSSAPQSRRYRPYASRTRLQMSSNCMLFTFTTVYSTRR